jgi:hypothetical protein
MAGRMADAFVAEAITRRLCGSRWWEGRHATAGGKSSPDTNKGRIAAASFVSLVFESLIPERRDAPCGPAAA